MIDLLATIRQRKIVQWLAGYLAVAWGAMEVADVLSGTWGWSPLLARVLFVLLAAGLGITAVLAWFHGEKGRQRVAPIEALLLAVFVLAGGVSAFLVAGARSDAGAVAESPAVASNVRSLVVLPFVDMSPGGGFEYLGDGIAETLINGLGRIDALRVVARTSAFAFRELGLDVREIAERLGVSAVLEGTVVQVAGRVRISANLVDGETGTALWVDRFDRESDASDLFELQDDVAQQILAALEIELAGAERVVRAGTASQDAQRAYYLGQHHWTARTTADLVLAAEYFEQAISADSSYADAWAGLALTYVLFTPQEYGVPGFTREEALRRARDAATRAIELDPESAGAYTALGEADWQEGALADGEENFRRAIDLNPGYAAAHHWLGDLLLVQLRGEEALAEIEIAESLSPVAPAILIERAEALMMLGRYDEALAQIDKSVALLPDAILVRSFALFFSARLGEWDAAAGHLRGAVAALGATQEIAERLETSLRDPAERAEFLRAWIEGRTDELAGGLPLSDQVFRPESAFVPILELRGEGEALDFLESLATGPRRWDVYGPMVPALMGAELSNTARGRRIMDLVNNRTP